MRRAWKSLAKAVRAPTLIAVRNGRFSEQAPPSSTAGSRPRRQSLRSAWDRSGAKSRGGCAIMVGAMAAETVVWLTERPDAYDYFYASGRFSGHVEPGSPGGEQLDDATLDEALRWARARSDVVLLRLVDSGHFSAGARHLDPEMPVWDDNTSVGPRRLRGLEMLDNSESDPPVLWDLRLHQPHVGVDRDAFEAFIQRDSRVEPAPDDARPASDGAVRAFVRASTQAQAEVIAAELHEAALRHAEREKPSSGWWKRGCSVYPHAPNAPVGFG
jgi:hypothetical protein